MQTLSFKDWMKQVDAWLTKKVGLSSGCLGDACYRDMYDDEISPEAAAQEALENDDTYSAMFNE
jgi:hypothetical protein